MNLRILTSLLLLLAPFALGAQSTLSGKLVEHATDRPMYCYRVVLLDSADVALDSTVTWRGGTFEFAIPDSALFRLRIGEPGGVPLFTEPERVGTRADLTRLYRIPWLAQSATLPDTVRPAPQQRFRPAQYSPGPRYPRELRDARISGYALFSFAIDTLGSIGAESALALRATHPLFAQAVQDAMPRMRFEPWKPEGAEHCALLQQRFEFEIAR
jgi:TonB family protein